MTITHNRRFAPIPLHGAGHDSLARKSETPF